MIAFSYTSTEENMSKTTPRISTAIKIDHKNYFWRSVNDDFLSVYVRT